MKKQCFFVSLALLFIHGIVTAQSVEIERVEPEFWWTGFQQTELQILVYGPDISNSDVEVDFPGVQFKKAVTTDNPNYLFVYLDVTERAEPCTIPITFTQGQDEYVHHYELKERNRSENRNRGFNSSDVIYLLMPDRFSNGNPENDENEGMLEGVNRDEHGARHGGDIQGIAQNLDYIKNLGMTAVWFTPIVENDMPPEYGAYHGYAATDMYRVDRRYGSNEEYVDLVEKAHNMGLKVIMDMIHNHIGTEHWFMKDLPARDWVHSLEEEGTTNYRTATVMDPYASVLDFDATVKGWFVTDMPDLDQRNELLADYLIQNTLWWIEYSGIDGIRMDTHPYPYKDYMAEWSRRVLDEFPEFNIVGEAWMPNVASTAYWQTGFPSPDGYESFLPSVTDFPFSMALRQGLNEEDGWDTGLSTIHEILGQDFLYTDPMLNVIFTGNHDLDRIFTVFGEDADKMKLAYVLALTTRGIPQLYYGDEILMGGSGPDGLKRKDFPGGWDNDSINAFTEQGRSQLSDETGHPADEFHNFVQKLATWRQDKEVIHHGDLTHFIPENNVYVYFRYDNEETIMVVLNANDEHQELHPERFAEFLGSYSIGEDILRNREVDVNRRFVVDGKSAMILELR